MPDDTLGIPILVRPEGPQEDPGFPGYNDQSSLPALLGEKGTYKLITNTFDILKHIITMILVFNFYSGNLILSN